MSHDVSHDMSMQGLLYKRGETALMTAEVMLMAVEVVYLWRALPCCPQSIKEELLERLEGVSHDHHMTDCPLKCVATPHPTTPSLPALQMSDAKPFHLALLSLMKGAILVDLDQGDRAERVGMQCWVGRSHAGHVTMLPSPCSSCETPFVMKRT